MVNSKRPQATTASGPPAAAGPFETERQASDTPAVQAIHAAFRASPGVGRMQPLNQQMLSDALAAAGVETGTYDRRIIGWLAGWEPEVVAVIAGLVVRAHASQALSAAQQAAVLDGLADAADLLERQAGQWCGDCEASPTEICDEHAADLDAASRYRRVAREIAAGGAR